MKKLGLFLSVVCLLCMVSCSQNSPKGVVKTYYSALQDQEYEEATQCFAGLESEDDMQAIAGKLKEGMEKNKGLKSFEVTGDSLCNDTLAFVTVKFIYGNGEEDAGNIGVVKQDGEWKIDPMSK